VKIPGLNEFIEMLKSAGLKKVELSDLVKSALP